MHPMLNPPGIKLLTLECNTLLSTFAPKFNLCRYNLAGETKITDFGISTALGSTLGKAVQVGPIKHTSKAPGCKRVKLKCD
jgi:hypothetical protein